MHLMFGSASIHHDAEELDNQHLPCTSLSSLEASAVSTPYHILGAPVCETLHDRKLNWEESAISLQNIYGCTYVFAVSREQGKSITNVGKAPVHTGPLEAVVPKATERIIQIIQIGDRTTLIRRSFSSEDID